NVIGPGAAGGKTSGIWSNALNSPFVDGLRNLSRSGAPLLGNARGLDFSNPVSNFANMVGFTAKVNGTGIPAADDQVFAVWDGAQMNLPFGKGTIIDTGAVKTFIPPRQVGSRYASAFTLRSSSAIHANNDSGLVTFFSNALSIHYLEGESANLANANHGQFVQ